MILMGESGFRVTREEGRCGNILLIFEVALGIVGVMEEFGIYTGA